MIPKVALAAFSIICASTSIGFILGIAEPHFEQFKLSPVMMGKWNVRHVLNQRSSYLSQIPYIQVSSVIF